MKKIKTSRGILSFIFILIVFPISKLSADTIDSFSKNKSGDFPSGWSTYPFQKGKAKNVYKIQREDTKSWIHAQDNQDISVPIFKDFMWSLHQNPILSWDWRALTLPQGAREDNSLTNDSACGVYVAFGKTSGTAIKYVWSSTLPVGHVWEKNPKKFYVVVKASGSAGLNQWSHVSANVLEDYKKLFGKEPSRDPSGIGIMTDGNATHSPSSCDYGGFETSSQ